MGSWLSWLAVYFQFCQKVWLGLHDGRPPAGRDETRMRDVMAQRYDKKRWYIQPTDAFYEEARRLNTASASTQLPSVTRPQTAAFDVQVTSALFTTADMFTYYTYWGVNTQTHLGPVQC